MIDLSDDEIERLAELNKDAARWVASINLADDGVLLIVPDINKHFNRVPGKVMKLFYAALTEGLRQHIDDEAETAAAKELFK